MELKRLTLQLNRKAPYIKETSRFPYIVSWCVLCTVVTQYVMAAVCFHSLSSCYVIKFAFIALFIITVSPFHLGRLPIWVTFRLCGSNCVCHIMCVTLCVSHCVFHILYHTCVTLCGARCVTLCVSILLRVRWINCDK